MSRLISRLTSVALAVPATLTATNNGAGVDVSRFTGLAQVILNSSAAGDAAGETADVKLQHSDDNATFTDVAGAAFAQVTNAAASHQNIMVQTDRLKKYVRVVTTMAGGTPSVTRGVSMVGTLAY
jgi:hypothetical protein